MNIKAIALGGLLVSAVTAHAADTPRTLFEMAGATQQAATLADGVLVIIDAQREYLDGALPLEGIDSAVAEIGSLLARARNAGTPVIHIIHKGGGALFNPAGPGFEFIAPLRPQANEIVLEKKRVSAFAATALEEAIKRSGRRNLILVGFMTHNCVSSTARAARDLGYAPTVIAAATATRALPGGKGGIVTAAALQAASLSALADRTATVVAMEKDIAE